MLQNLFAVNKLNDPKLSNSLDFFGTSYKSRRMCAPPLLCALSARCLGTECGSSHPSVSELLCGNAASRSAASSSRTRVRAVSSSPSVCYQLISKQFSDNLTT